MLTMPEEFLFLTLKDKAGRSVYFSSALVSTGLVGAAIMDLALHDRIDSDLEHIFVVEQAPTGEACLDLVLTACAAPGFDCRQSSIFAQLIGSADTIRDAALKRLCERGVLEKVEGGFFGFLRSPRYSIVDDGNIREAKIRLRAILLEGELPDARDVCLLSLANSCKLMEQLVPAQDIGRARERLDQLVRMDLLGQAVMRYIDVWKDALSLAVASAHA